MTDGGLTVVEPGVFSTVQDEGRHGLLHLAVSPSGAADLPAYRLANRLVGNRLGAAAIETVLGTLRVRVEQESVIAVTGAPVPFTVDGHQQAVGSSVHVDAGADITFGWATSGLRSYLAVRGGINVEPTLGSRSTDTMGALGPAALQADDHLPIGVDTERLPAPDLVPTHQIEPEPVLSILAGPRLDWITTEAEMALVQQDFAVSDQIDRIGVRLTGIPLIREITRELPSEALLHGAVQLPPNGEPIIFGPDHPTTGGYPVIAVVVERQLPVIGQLRPGQPVRFRWAS